MRALLCGGGWGRGAVGAQPAERQLLEVAQELGEVGHRREAAARHRTPAGRLGREVVDQAAEEREVHRDRVHAPEDTLAHPAPGHALRHAEDLGDVRQRRGLDAVREHLADEQHGERGAPRAHSGKRREQAVQRPARVPALRLGRLQVGGQLGEARDQDRAVEPALAAEVVADQRLVHAGLGGHRSDRDRVEAALGEQPRGGGEQRPPRGLGVAARAGPPAAAPRDGLPGQVNQPDG
jgi:hypothetical protein